MALNRTSGPSTARVTLRVVAAGAAVVALSGLALSLMGVVAGMWIGLAGLAAVALIMIADLPVLGEYLSQRRGAAGAGGMLQIGLAIALAIGVNWFAFQHYRRFDWTWDNAFTLNPKVREQLAQLRGDSSSDGGSVTDIIVFQRGIAFGHGGDHKPDSLDAAAGKKIVEKVQDLADMFQDLGPRFRVQVFDYRERTYKSRMDALQASNKELYEAMQAAPVDSIFFHSAGKIQRLAFHDIYQVDKIASEQSHNLVLNYQGEAPFANRILNIEEKKPLLAAAVIHPVLTFGNPVSKEYTMNGAKKALESYGFRTRDIVLRKTEGGRLSEDSVVLTYDESRFERVSELLPAAEMRIAKNERVVELAAKQIEEWKQPLSELNKTYVYIVSQAGEGVELRSRAEALVKAGAKLRLIDVDNDDKENQQAAWSARLSLAKNLVAKDRKERDTLLAEKQRLNVDELTEKRRISDVEAKMNRILSDVDLLVIPRITAINYPREFVIPNELHKLDEAQLRAVKEFMRRGKPVLFLLGPSIQEDSIPPRGPTGEDSLEKELAKLGLLLPKQTILFDSDLKEFEERKFERMVLDMGSDEDAETPAVSFDWDARQLTKTKRGDANPIRTSLKVFGRAVGAGKGLDLRIRHPRPVYALTSDGKGGKVLDESAIVLMTGTDSWNESQPFTKDGKAPEPPSPGNAAAAERGKDKDRGKEDGDKGQLLLEKRRGPFPIAVTQEKPVTEWFPDDKSLPKTRFAIIGHGGVFVGNSLPAMNEKLLLDTTNWLLGRDDLLARIDPTPWSYPRTQLSSAAALAWKGFGAVVLPAFFLFLGAAVLMLRYVR